MDSTPQIKAQILQSYGCLLDPIEARIFNHQSLLQVSCPNTSMNKTCYYSTTCTHDFKSIVESDIQPRPDCKKYRHDACVPTLNFATSSKFAMCRQTTMPSDSLRENTSLVLAKKFAVHSPQVGGLARNFTTSGPQLSVRNFFTKSAGMAV